MRKLLTFAAASIAALVPAFASADEYVTVNTHSSFVSIQADGPILRFVSTAPLPQPLFWLDFGPPPQFFTLAQHPSFVSGSDFPSGPNFVREILFSDPGVPSSLVPFGVYYFSESPQSWTGNALVSAANSTMSGWLAAVGQAVSWETGQVVIGFTAIALLLFLIAYVRKVQSRPQG